MGSFIGHAFPGLFFFSFGLWWLTQVMRRHFLCRQTRQPFRSILTFKPICCPLPRLRELPVESIIKIVLCGFGIVVEIIGGTNHITHRFDSVGNAQHITMYFFFALSGVFDLLVLKGWAPEGSDYMSVVVALLVEGALFKFHLYGRTELDVVIHTLLLYVIGFSAFVVALETAFRTNPLLPIMRALLAMLQGMWFFTVGVILYNPFPGAQPWDEGNHRSLMFAVALFSWHVAITVLLGLAVGGVTACCHRDRGRGRYSKLDEISLKGLDGGSVADEESVAGGVSSNGLGVYVDRQGGVGSRSSSESLHLLLGKAGGENDDDNSDVEFQAPVRK